MKKALFSIVFLLLCFNINSDSLLLRTPLHLASQHGLTEVVQALLNKGIAVDSKDALGNTALHLAVHYPEIVKLLLDAGANPDSLNALSKTPLHYAIPYYNSVELLLESGADPSIKDSLEHTPLDLLLNFPYGYRNQETILLLIESMQF